MDGDNPRAIPSNGNDERRERWAQNRGYIGVEVSPNNRGGGKSGSRWCMYGNGQGSLRYAQYGKKWK